MKKAANDNTDTWIELAAATANLVRYLQNSQNHERDGERQTPEKCGEEEKTEEHRKAVKQGLRQIERFERRYWRNE